MRCHIAATVLLSDCIQHKLQLSAWTYEGQPVACRHTCVSWPSNKRGSACGLLSDSRRMQAYLSLLAWQRLDTEAAEGLPLTLHHLDKYPGGLQQLSALLPDLYVRDQRLLYLPVRPGLLELITCYADTAGQLSSRSFNGICMLQGAAHGLQACGHAHVLCCSHCTPCHTDEAVTSS